LKIDYCKLKIAFMLIDSHAHVNFNAFKDDYEAVINKALDNDVLIVNVGSQYSTSKRAVKIANEFETGVWAIVGIHPIHLNKKTIYLDTEELASAQEIKANGEDYDAEKYLELAQDKKTVAIGEVGLDYHHFEEGDDTETLIKKQKEVLLKFICLANEVDKPLMVHCWDAYPDLLEILKNYPVNKKGIIHSFIGGYKTARKFIELGYKIGLNGIITYTDDYARLLKEIPLEHIVIETDCPYLGPAPVKGERNEPAHVKYVAEKIAQMTGLEFEEVARVTTENAKRVFNIVP